MFLLPKRHMINYSFLVIIVVTLGLCSRRFSIYLPDWINLYLGDALWALMVFFLCGLLFRSRETRWIAVAALLFSFAIEISQLYHSPWVDSLRATRLGGLVLGYGFLWRDLISYAIGIGIGVLIEMLLLINYKNLKVQ